MALWFLRTTIKLISKQKHGFRSPVFQVKEATKCKLRPEKCILYQKVKDNRHKKNLTSTDIGRKVSNTALLNGIEVKAQINSMFSNCYPKSKSKDAFFLMLHISIHFLAPNGNIIQLKDAGNQKNSLHELDICEVQTLKCSILTTLLSR